MKEVTIQIRQPDDSGKYWTAKLSSDFILMSRNITLTNDRGAKDPIHKALTDFFKSALKRNSRDYRYRRHSSVLSFPSDDFNGVINFC